MEMRVMDKFSWGLGLGLALTMAICGAVNTFAAPEAKTEVRLKESKSKSNLAKDWDAWSEAYAKARYGNPEGLCDLPK